jgi:hypothetical protein
MLIERLPQRPDASVLNEAIPLFYVGRNRRGLWVAREAEGRSGGIFLTRRAAARFAEESCEPGGCATMYVSEPLELDFASSGIVNSASSLRAAIAAVGKFLAKIRLAFANERLHRRILERDLFGGRYTLCSKNDDDFPVVR